MRTHIRNLGIGLLAAAGAATSAEPLGAQVLTTERVATGLSFPTYATSPVGDYHRLFIVEQDGLIKIMKDGVVLGTPFLNITSKVLFNGPLGSEVGLLGLAFHPNYASNGFFYVSYTQITGSGDSIVERYSVNPNNPDQALPGSAVTVFGPLNQPQSNHNGGCIQFGPDGMLYLALGDGGNFNDTGTGHVTGGNAQSLTTQLGKMLRLDVDIAFPHVAAGNPFVGGAAVDDLVWSLGWRNPWRFSFDRATGNAYIGDVGQDAREEVSFEPAGASGRNYGWRCMEGFACTGLSGCTCNAPALTLPIHDYSHAGGGGHCAVTGGYVYRGCAMPGLAGTYFFADFCSAQIWSFRYDGANLTQFTNRTAELAPNVGSINSISSFAEDAYGEIYILDLGGGEIFKILPAAGFADCNANDVDDACETAVGAAFDLNGNSVPDECECAAAIVHCQAKFTSNFCFPQISSTGFPAGSGLAPFEIDASGVDNFKNGLLFFGLGPANIPFMGGTLCVNPPLRRTTVQNSGGTAPPTVDCSGTYTFDMAALIASGSEPILVPGADISAQYWFRDPADAFGVGLSNAVRFTICNL